MVKAIFLAGLFFPIRKRFRRCLNQIYGPAILFYKAELFAYVSGQKYDVFYLKRLADPLGLELEDL